MATYRKKLLDKDGNTIIPALAGDETGWVNTGDIADEAVTTAKIDDGSVTVAKLAQNAASNAVKTSGNLTPTSDTASAWIALFDTPGYYVTGYSGKCFTDQPTNYGVLETIFRTSQSIMQRYTSTVNDVYIRTGDLDGWHGVTGSSSFAQVIDTGVSTGTITMATGFGKSGDYCRKVGNIVSWGMQLTRENTMSAESVTVGTLPSGFRPNNNTIGSGSTVSGENLYTLVTPDGSIRVCPRVQLGTSTSAYIGGTFIIP